MSNAPMPMQPTPTEIANWSIGRGNARQQYDQGLARNQFARTQAGIGYQTQLRGMEQANTQARGQFDSPYIANGMFNSGVRQQGLTNMYNNQANQQAGVTNSYLQQTGQFDIEDIMAAATRDHTIGNIDQQELAGRTQTAAQIRGII